MRPSELFDLSGRVAIVTGGGSGIGLQMATGLAEAGASLVLCARKFERCEEAAVAGDDALADRLGLFRICLGQLACLIQSARQHGFVLFAAAGQTLVQHH